MNDKEYLEWERQAYERRKQRKQHKRKRKALTALFLLILAAFLLMASFGDMAAAESPVEVVEVAEEVREEAPKEVVVQMIGEEKTEYFDIPLSEDLQDYIMEVCESYEIDPAIIIAMAERESRFNAEAIGDNGDALGLLQVQPKWHKERIAWLGVEDLLNPYQNVAVAVDYLAELIDRDKGVEWAVMAYNAGATGANKGYGAGYARDVLAKAEILRGAK